MTDTLTTSPGAWYDHPRHGPGDKPERAISIGEMAKRTGVSARTIRCYEELGILPAPVRTVGGTRRCPSEYVSYIEGALLLKDLGFTLEEIGDLGRWALEGTGVASERMRTLLRDKAALLERHVRILNRMRDLVQTTRDGRLEASELMPALLRLPAEEAVPTSMSPQTGAYG